METGQCKLGDKCRYAHSDNEIRETIEAKNDRPGFHKQVVHNEVAQLKQTALPFQTNVPTASLAKNIEQGTNRALDEEGVKQAAHAQMDALAQQNMVAAIAAQMPPPAPVPPPPPAPANTSAGKSHEEMAEIFAAAAQHHQMEADRQRQQRVAAAAPTLNSVYGYVTFN